MSNNSLNHNTPGNSGNDDPDPSSHNLPGSSNNDEPGPSSHDSPGSSNNDNPEVPEVPFVSRYGMKHAKNSLQDVEFYRATLFNLKTEPIEDRERRTEEANRLFLRQCREQEEIDTIDEQAGDLLPEETNTEIKSEPIDEIEENTSMLYMETEPLDYLPESYSEPMENSSHIDAINSEVYGIGRTRVNLQQFRNSEVEMIEVNNLSPENSSYINEANPRANESVRTSMYLQQYTDSEEEMDEIDNLSTGNSSYIDESNTTAYEFENNRMFIPQLRDSEEEINGTNMQLVVPEAIVLSNIMTETPPPIVTITNPRANEFESNGMFLQQFRDSEEEMDETDNTIPLVVPPVLPVPLEPEEINERNAQLVVPEAIVLSDTMTETPPSIDTITIPRANEFESNGVFLQQPRDSEEEMDETDNTIPLVVPPVLPVPLEPEEINERNTQLIVPEATVSSNTMTETPPSIDTITIPRASDLDNGITNTIENPPSVQRRTRKKKNVILTPTRFSTRIRKPRIMYNV